MIRDNFNFSPPEGITYENEKKETLLTIFSNDWLDLQTYIARALQLPISTGSFKEKYGDFSSSNQVQDVINTMESIHGLSNDFGDPISLSAQLSTSGSLPADITPSQIYPNIVWLGLKIKLASVNFGIKVTQLLEGADKLTPQEKKSQFIYILTNPKHGMAPIAGDMARHCEDLIKKLTIFQGKLVPLNNKLLGYTSNSSQFVADVKRIIKSDDYDIEKYQQEADEAYKTWRDLTIAASSVAGGITILSGGLLIPLAAITGGSLGTAAAIFREKYNEACENRNKATEDEKKKTLLLNDLIGLNNIMPTVNEASGKFLTTLQKMSGAWLGMQSQLQEIANSYPESDFTDETANIIKLSVEEAEKKWKIVGSSSDDFIINSLVTFNFMPYGTPIPAVA